MGVMDTMMDMMIKTISKEKREQMMINMMPDDQNHQQRKA
jgi:hypothetical protein